MKKYIGVIVTIITFLFMFAVGYGITQNKVETLDKKVEKIEAEFDKEMSKDTERALQQAIIDTKQTVLLSSLDRLIEKLERKINAR